MNSFRKTALCAILTAFSAQAVLASSNTASSFASSSSPRMIGGNGVIYHHDINTQGGIYNDAGKVKASIPKAPISVAVALKNDDEKTLNLFLQENKTHRGNTGRNDFDATRPYNFKYSKIAKLLPENKVMTVQEAADTIGATKCSKLIAREIAKQPESYNKQPENYSSNSSSMTVNPELADAVDTYGVGSEN